MSLRLFTKEQMAEGLRIDLKIERAMRGLQSFINNLPKRVVERRHFPDYIVAGYTPIAFGSGNEPSEFGDGMPWLPTQNADADVVAGLPDAGVQNEWRAKGTDISPPPLDEIYHNQVRGYQFMWSTSFLIDRPAILDALAVWFWTSATVYTNNFLYGSDFPPGRAENQPVNDIIILAEVESPFSPGDRRLSSQVFLRKGVSTDAWKHDYSGRNPANDGFATLAGWSGSTPRGLSFVAQDLNIPLPAGARLRLGIVIPEWQRENVSGWFLPGPAGHPAERCWDRQSVGWNLVLAEGTVK